MTGKIVEAKVVDVTSEVNRAVVLTLADGAELRIKVDVAEVLRIPGEVNAQGEPVYLVKSGNTISLLDMPRDT